MDQQNDYKQQLSPEEWLARRNASRTQGPTPSEGARLSPEEWLARRNASKEQSSSEYSSLGFSLDREEKGQKDAADRGQVYIKPMFGLSEKGTAALYSYAQELASIPEGIGQILGIGNETTQEAIRTSQALEHNKKYSTAAKAGQIAGYIVNPVNLIPIGRAATLPEFAFQSALWGGASGALSAKTEDESRMSNTIHGFVGGYVGGAMLGGVIRMGGKLFGKDWLPWKATAEEKEQVISALEKEEEEAGIPRTDPGRNRRFVEAPEDAHINAKATAEKLIDSGASEKKIRRAIKDNPLVEDYLEEYMNRHDILSGRFGYGNPSEKPAGRVVKVDDFPHPDDSSTPPLQERLERFKQQKQSSKGVIPYPGMELLENNLQEPNRTFSISSPDEVIDYPLRQEFLENDKTLKDLQEKYKVAQEQGKPAEEVEGIRQELETYLARANVRNTADAVGRRLYENIEGSKYFPEASERTRQPIQKTSVSPGDDAELHSLQTAHRDAEKSASSAADQATEYESLAKKAINPVDKEKYSKAAKVFRDKEKEAQVKAGSARKDLEEHLNKAKNQYGGPDPRILSMLAAGGATAAAAFAYLSPEHQAEIAGTAGALGAVLVTKGKGGMHFLEDSLGKLLEHEKYSMSSILELPKDKTDFSKDTVRSMLNKPGVGKEEKELINSILEQAPGHRVTAKELVNGVKLATGDFILEHVKTPEAGKYGLESISDKSLIPKIRGTSSDMRMEAEEPRTNLFLLPEYMEQRVWNHFGEPRLYGWTRNFFEDNIRHVVEIQSDLGQKAKKLTSEEFKNTFDEISRRQGERDQHMVDRSILDMSDVDVYNKWYEVLEGIEKRMVDLEKKIAAGKAYQDLSIPLVNYPRRLIRETLNVAAQYGEKVVRFATADTIGKVEGWEDLSKLSFREIQALRRQFPKYMKGYKEGEKYPPIIKGVYDRYAGPITSFLNRLGGKPYTDHLGHTWIEVPVPKKGPFTMYGNASPQAMSYLAGAAGGAIADPQDPVTGAALGIAAVHGGWKVFSKQVAENPTISGITKNIDTTSIGDAIKAWDVRRLQTNWIIGKDANSIASKIKGLDKKSADSLIYKLENPELPRTPQEHQIILAFRALDNKVFEAGKEAGVIDEYVKNHISRLYDYGSQGKSNTYRAFQTFVEKTLRGPTSGMGTKSRFNLDRLYKTLAEAEKAGLVPKTRDLSELYAMSAKSVLQAVSNKKLVGDLKKAINPVTGDKFVIPLKNGMAPLGYSTVQHPQFQGLAVDNAIAQDLKSMFHPAADIPVFAVMQGISAAAKTSIFSLSGFHIKTLSEGFVGAMRNPQQVMELGKMYKMYKEGGDLLDAALRGGLEISHGTPDVDMPLVNAMVKDTEEILDKALGAGGVVRVPANLVKGLNKFLWEVVHPTFKLSTFGSVYKKALLEGKSEKEAGEIAARFANDIFGGLNMRRIAIDSNTKFGRGMANFMASKEGQRWLQIGMLAPDWTISTVRSWEGALRKGADPFEKNLYRRYIAQSILLVGGLMDAIQYSVNGKHLWENRDEHGNVDPTAIRLQDGTKIYGAKHLFETLHWVMQPNQVMLSKLGYLPSELVEQGLNKDFLLADTDKMRGVPEISDWPNKATAMDAAKHPDVFAEADLLPRMEHMFKHAAPIPVTSAMEDPVKAGLGMLGIIQSGGTTAQQHRAILRAQRQKKRQEIMEKLSK